MSLERTELGYFIMCSIYLEFKDVFIQLHKHLDTYGLEIVILAN